MKSSSPHARQGSQWALIAALGFLLISIVVSVLIIQGSSKSKELPTESPEQQASPETQIQASQTPSPLPPTATATLTPQSTLTPANTGWTIAIMPVNPEADQTLTDQLAAAYENALPNAFLPEPVVVETVIPSQDSDPSTIEVDDDVTLLVIWEDAGNNLIRLYLYVPYQPSIVRIDQPVDVWSIYAPEEMPVYTSQDSEFLFPITLSMGFLELYAGRVDLALQHFRTAQTLPMDVPIEQYAHNSAGALFGIGQAYTRTNDLTTALQMFSQAIRLVDSFPAAKINRGNVYLLLGDLDTAFAAYQTPSTNKSTAAGVLYNKMLAYYQSGEIDKALEQINALIDLTGETAWSMNLLGVMNYHHMSYTEAYDSFERAAQLAPDAAALYFNQGATLHQLQEYEKAIEVYDKALALEADQPLIYAYQGLAYQASGNPQKAERSFTEAVNLDEAYFEAYLWRAQLRFELEEYDQAMADAQTALQLNPGAHQAYSIMGNIYVAEEKFVAARDAFSDAIKTGDDSASIYARRGYTWHRLYYYGFAALDYEAAIDRGATELELFYRLAFAYYDDSRYAQALTVMQGAVNGGLETGEAYAALSIILDANLLRDEADRAYSRAIEIDPQMGDIAYLESLPLWSSSAVGRARSILNRLDTQ